ncbi:MAG: DegT/DnrJ/EryC1/StrS family aminotransferase [Actinomycetota bacterium]
MIPHSRPTVPSAEEWATLAQSLEPGWVADGPLVRRFEAELSPWFGGSGGVAVNSGSNALQLALLAVGVEPESEVLVPAYCCAALLNAIASAGARPVLVDSEPGGHNLSLEAALTQKTAAVSAVVVAHMFGEPADAAAFRALGVPIIEDCAQSLGAAIGGSFTGGSGDAAIGSFFATKVITTGHGGMVAARNPDVVSRVRDLVEYDNREEWRPRFSYGFTEMQAALGLWQIARLPQFLARRRAIADYYTERFSARHLAVPLKGAGAADRIYYRYVLRAREADEAIHVLRAAGVDAKRPVFRPLHQYLGGEYPQAQAAHRQIVSLPLYPELTDSESAHVADAVLRSEELWLRHG